MAVRLLRALVLSFLLVFGRTAFAVCTLGTNCLINTNTSVGGNVWLMSNTSGTEFTGLTVKTAKTTSTWFQFQPNNSGSTSVSNDSSTANGKGWLDDTPFIASGSTIPAGTWTVQANMADSSGSQTGSTLSIHIYTYNGASYSNQCNFTATVSMSTTPALKTASGSCGEIVLGGSDKLYMEVYYMTGSNTSTANNATTYFALTGSDDYINFPTPTGPSPSAGRKGQTIVTRLERDHQARPMTQRFLGTP